MKKVGLLACLLAGLAFASAKSFTVTFSEPAMVGATQLKAGDYKVEVQSDKVVLKHGHETAEAAIKAVTMEKKYDATSISMAKVNGTNRLEEIEIGGTHTKLVLE
ncbi:MAG: hypothetical protein ACLP59_27370 [Bryobacteraceae bacterium]